MTPADDDALGRLARAAAPDVLTEALQRAREDAVTRLSALLADAIVDAALTGPHTAGGPAPESAPPSPPADGEQVLYAYALARSGLPLPEDLPALTGGASVRQVTEDGLALLVSPVTPEQLQVDEDDLSEDGRLATLVRGHDAVLRAASDLGPVLPLRFGTVVPSEEAAHRLVRERADAARAQLDRVDGTREWGVRLVRVLTGEPRTAGPQPRREEMSGTEYLSARRAALAERDRAEQDAARAAALLEDALAPHVTDVLRRGGSTGSSLLLDVAYLVPREREPGFRAEALALGEELRSAGLELELTGPWPPYSFVSLDEGGPA
jgi:hypothetical protein